MSFSRSSSSAFSSSSVCFSEYVLCGPPSMSLSSSDLLMKHIRHASKIDAMKAQANAWSAKDVKNDDTVVILLIMNVL